MRRAPAAAVLLALSAPTAAAHTTSDVAGAAPEASGFWMLAAFANLVMMVTFAAIALPLWRAIYEGDQLFSNPLLTGFALIFTTCSVSHGIHFEHTLLPNYHGALHALPFMSGPTAYNYATDFGLWSRVAMTDPGLLLVDVLTMGLGVWYFLLRKRQSRFFEGAELADDLEVREREAHAMHDEIVEDVSQALLLLDLDREDEAHEVVADTLDGAQSIVDNLLEAATITEVEAGDLVQDDEGPFEASPTGEAP